MRTQEEIVAQYREREGRDVLGFEVNEYIFAMSFESAKPLLKESATTWDPAYKTDEDVREMAIDYMAFAWEKANNCRGISACRSLAHYQAWLWLLGDNELWPTFDEFEHYGKAHLRKICEYFGLDADKWDDGVRVNSDC